MHKFRLLQTWHVDQFLKSRTESYVDNFFFFFSVFIKGRFCLQGDTNTFLLKFQSVSLPLIAPDHATLQPGPLTLNANFLSIKFTTILRKRLI